MMQLHNAFDPTFFGSLRRQLSNRGHRSRDRSSSLLALDMSEHVDWISRTETFFDEPATNPTHTVLILELPDVQAVCLNHGERQFRIERSQAITVRDVLIELDAFLHRPAPSLVGNFTTLTEEKKEALLSNSGEGVPQAPRVDVVNFDSTTVTPDSSESSLSSNADSSGIMISKDSDLGESVLHRWLDEKTVFAGLRCSENHDFKLIVRMMKPNGKASHT